MYQLKNVHTGYLELAGDITIVTELNKGAILI